MKQRWALLFAITLLLAVCSIGCVCVGCGDWHTPGYVVGWGTLSLISAGIAQGKNRKGLNWFLLTLVFGPLALFLLVVADRLAPTD